MVALSLNLEDCDPISFVYISFFHNHFLYYQSIFLHNFINCFTQRDIKEKYMKIIFTIFVKQQSNKSAGYKLWHLLSIKSKCIILQKKIMQHDSQQNINASGWYKLQLTLQYFTVKSLYFLFLPFFFYSDISKHTASFFIFIRNKKIQASALIISQTDHKLMLVILFWRHHWYLLWPLFSLWGAVEHFATQVLPAQPTKPWSLHMFKGTTLHSRSSIYKETLRLVTLLTLQHKSGCGGREKGSWRVRSSSLLNSNCQTWWSIDLD